MNTQIYVNKIGENLFATFAPGKIDNKWCRDIDLDLINLK